MMNFAILSVIIFTLCENVSCGYGGYETQDNVDILYKFFPTPKVWSQAIRICREENATLAMPANAEEVAALVRIFNRYPATSIVGSPHPDFLLLGFHDIFTEGEYITETGLPIQYFFHKWLPNDPNNGGGNEDCGSLHRTGFLNDYPCAVPGVFICQKQMNSGCSIPQSDGCIPDNKGYIYAPQLGSVYKLHMNIKPWAEARIICESEGGYLAIINSVAEKDFLVKLFIEPDNRVLFAFHTDFVLLGFHDMFKEGQFVTVEGDLLELTGFTQWGGGQPDSGANENCGSMHTTGLLHDFPCSVRAVFICEKKGIISNLRYELQDNVDILYKFFPTPKLWSQAIRICREENATLAMPANAKEMAALVGIFSRYPATSIVGSPHPDFSLLGFHDFFIEGEYITETGLPIQYSFHKWLANQPDNAGNEDCGSMYRTGFLNDYPCAAPGVFICQKQVNPGYSISESDRCIPYDKGCTYAPQLGSVYKIHLNIKPWADARTICESEGGYLAIINSVAEKDFLVKLFNEPDNKVLAAIHSDYVLLGFHDIFKEGEFVTVEGDLLQLTGFTQWGVGQPDNAGGNENCGSMHGSGVLNDFPCSVPAVFICEKKVTITNVHA